MDLKEYLDHLNRGEKVEGGSEVHRFMHEASQEALRITSELNGSYHTPEEIRQLMSRLTGKEIDETFRMFPPFYTDCGKNITLGKNVFINKTGNSKMASGGMGDTLTGIITALVAQGYSNMDATLLGAYIHGLAAEYSARDRYSIIARDLIESIPFVMGTL